MSADPPDPSSPKDAEATLYRLENEARVIGR